MRAARRHIISVVRRYTIDAERRHNNNNATIMNRCHGMLRHCRHCDHRRRIILTIPYTRRMSPSRRTRSHARFDDVFRRLSEMVDRR